ncbi:hypothetical protein POM88_020705 [Heracleum sosnowskyi]|uniref:Uncharacterized protein n=1 Tax=Heracleum sosnowskyi TaxID=360622 RepID=A0AAD8ICD2_9APIA|nr:hypothetical protein POM88_020705 [Heracleum sosnowskyi]
MIDDLLLEKTKTVVNKMTSYSDKQLQYFALAEIDKILKSIGKSLMQFKQLPQPPANYLQSGTNNLVIDETSYNLSEMEFEFNKLFPHCNPEQLEVYTELYVAISRVTPPYGLKVFIDDKNAKATNLTKNVVYHEIFYNLHVP